MVLAVLVLLGRTVVQVLLLAGKGVGAGGVGNAVGGVGKTAGGIGGAGGTSAGGTEAREEGIEVYPVVTVVFVAIGGWGAE